MIAWVLFAARTLPRLVHMFSASSGYLTRPYIVYRSRDLTRARSTCRGWEPVAARPVKQKGR
jgi:nitrate reductase gamma subunit